MSATSGMPTGANIAHRGASAYAPEHTAEAIERALALHADYIELDIRQTCDGRLVNLHDATLQRTTDVEKRFPDRAKLGVERFTLREIKRLDAGAWFGPEFSGQRVLTLEEVCDIIGSRAGLWIETKPSAAYPEMEERLARALTARGWHPSPPERLVVQSFSVESVRKLERFLPDVARVQLLGARDDLSPTVLDGIRSYARGTAPDKSLITSALVEAAHARDLAVYPYTFRGADPATVKAALRRALDAGVDGCITDHPDLLTEVLQARR